MASEIVRRKEPISPLARTLLEIARKWQERWRRDHLFEPSPDPSKPKFFITAAFPYPNSPLHLGHSRTYTITDAYARFKRMQGYNVLFPMGFHYTGTPILTMAESIAKGDKELIELLLEVYDVPPEDVKKLGDPLSLARYFHEDAKRAMQEMGYSIDWRREFTTIDKDFSAFITWQYLRLHDKGYITRGTHPVGWCPVHNMPVGMHDTKGDVEPEIGEFTLILFEGEDGFLPAATLRPETVFGVTNVWVNPDAEYVKARIDGRVYIVSKRAAFKLKFQRDSLEILEEFKGERLVGLRVRNPATGRLVPVLPAGFVDPDTATGIVMSVPAHAPFDYVALRELVDKQPELLEKLGISPEELKPIPLIRVKGYGDVPAAEIVERMGIKSQLEKDKLEEATRKLYSDEYHSGVMREDIVKLVYSDAAPEVRRFAVAAVKAWIAGRPVREARDAAASWLKALGYGDAMYEIMNKPVYCRCGNEIVVKVLKNQWFIDYGNEEWKELARELLEQMRIVPPEMREEFKKTIEWLRERAVARTRGLGTPLPWDPDWIIESLSDSTIYMAFYTIDYKLREAGVKPEQLKPVFWDYVLLGKGSAEKVAKETGIDVGLLRELREEFDYWYPLDSRHSGRDLVPNHLTFFIFHHAALFPRQKWPRQIVVNGFVMLEGKKMSKSLRNIIPLRRALRIYGPDTVRAAILSAAELLQDANFTDEHARSVLSQISKYMNYVGLALEADSSESVADRWLRSRLQRSIEKVTEAFEELRLRAASITLLYEMENDVAKYLSMRGGPGPALREYVEAWTRMLSPIIPHVAEEMWHKLGHDTYVSLEHWPLSNKALVSESDELLVEYVERVIEDIKSILRVYKGKPEEAVIAVAAPEKWNAARIVASIVAKRGQLRDAIRALIASGMEGKEAAAFARKLFEQLRQASADYVKLISSVESFDEKKAIEELAEYIAQRTGLRSIKVLREDEAEEIPEQKRRQIMPTRPAILIK